MCGVIGLIYERNRADLGVITSRLLRTLEYRGYDSTGAAIQGLGEEVDLRKDVGAPSVMAKELGIVDLGGQILCAQVRWATFGAVNRDNAQPHVVRCHTHMYGAHNGNVTNCDGLKLHLTSQGHEVRSDNDGEMVVHTVEHAFAARLADLPDDGRADHPARIRAMRHAVVEANARLQGSYAAVVVDPVTRHLWAVKKGSSLYFGVGEDEVGGRFAIASSDLSSILKVTSQVVPLLENEFVQFDWSGFEVYRMTGSHEGGLPIERQPAASRLRAEDTELREGFTTFMEQEIHDQIGTTRDVIRLFRSGSETDRTETASDTVREHEEAEELAPVIAEFCRICNLATDKRARIHVICCGTSYHAAKVAALFFAELAGVELLASLPGEFRGQHAALLRDGDVLIAVSQSGETKDLIDILNDVINSGRDVRRIAVVNNVNSTLALEKAQLVVPLHCGPEIAVPATKSFLNQLTVFYCLALELGRQRGGDTAALAQRSATLEGLPKLIEQTLCMTDATLDEAAELLYLRPSMHLLATRLLGVAKEGALKVREVVLNHTEGFEGSEFKHGPNTILGFNTLFGPQQVERLVEQVVADARNNVRSDPALMLEMLAADYPLVYITGPDKRDIALTVSQINTHKIRGSITVVIAEENPALREAATKPPADNPDYRSLYIALPATGDTLMTAFTATVALQRLALKMSLRKLAWLDAHGVRDHGVHPDVPKNVSKSITVD